MRLTSPGQHATHKSRSTYDSQVPVNTRYPQGEYAEMESSQDKKKWNIGTLSSLVFKQAKSRW